MDSARPRRERGDLAVVRAVDEAVNGEPQLGGGVGGGDEHVPLERVKLQHIAELVEVDAAASVGVGLLHHLATNGRNDE